MKNDSPPGGSLPKPGADGANTGPASRQDTDRNSSRPVVPDHELLKLIGRGAYGQVWLARNVMGAYRAIKVVYRSDFEHDRPFERELEGIQKFEPVSRTDDSQVDILHVGRNDTVGYFYYVMELADDERTGQTIDVDHYSPKSLKSELHRQGRLPLEACLQIGVSLTTALEHLHKHGLVHRDVKPSNIIFVNSLPKLADVGLVASTDATLSFVGTAGYLPPEGPGTPQADIYSLGKVLYELCTGRDRQNFPELPTEWEEFVDQEGLLEFNAVLMRACESDVRRRYQSAWQMHADLALLQTGKSVKRLRLIERRLALITRVGLAAAAIAAVAVAAYFGAVKQARRAQRAEREMAQQLYAADISRTMQFWEKGNLKRAIELLEAHRPDTTSRIKSLEFADGNDLRSFEWFYLWRLCHQDDAVNTVRISSNNLFSANFSADGSILATSGADGRLNLWDIHSQQQLVTLGHSLTDIEDWAFCPNGRRIAYSTTNGSIELCDLSTNQVVARLSGFKQGIHCLAFNPDGRLLGIVERNSTSITLWDLAAQRALDSLRSDEGGYIQGLAFSHDDKILAAGHRDNLVTFWDTSARQKLGDMEVPMGFAGHLAFSPDDKTVLVAGLRCTAALCDVGSRKTVGALWGHAGLVNCLAYSPDGNLIATGSEDHTVKLWNPVSLQEIATFKGHQDSVHVVAFSGDSRTVSSVAADGTMKVWEAKRKPNVEVLFGHEDWSRSVAFSPDGTTLASAGKDKTVKLWDAATGRLLFTFLGHRRPVYRLAWSSDGRTLASVSGLVTEENGLGEVKLWDVIERRELATLTNQNNFACSVAFSPNGRILASANGNGSVALWDVGSRRLIATWTAHSNQVQGLAFSPDGKILATCSHDNTARLWDVAARRELAIFQGSTGNQTIPGFAVWCVAFAADGQTLAVGNDDGTVMLWTISTRKLSRILKGVGGKIYSISFPPDGKTMVTGNQNGTVSLWHLATGQEMFALQGHQDFVESVAFSPDGRVLASASADKTVRLWRAAEADKAR